MPTLVFSTLEKDTTRALKKWGVLHESAVNSHLLLVIKPLQSKVKIVRRECWTLTRVCRSFSSYSTVYELDRQ